MLGEIIQANAVRIHVVTVKQDRVTLLVYRDLAPWYSSVISAQDYRFVT
jgi:hypothetical protein